MTQQSTFCRWSLSTFLIGKNKWLIPAVVLLLAPAGLIAQSISGKVIDIDGDGLEGATIIVQGTTV